MDDTRQVLLEWLRSEIDAQQAAKRGVPNIREALRDYARSKEPSVEGERPLEIAYRTQLYRDQWGVAHVRADTLEDAYVALGFSMGQDRLWQLDYLRRRASGRLAEILGPASLHSDRLMRTLGLHRSAEQAVAEAGVEVTRVLAALSRGINAAADQARERLPIEFELLDYTFQDWQPADSVAVWKWRWWMLSGRLDLIALQEISKRCLPEPLLQAFLEVESAESIVPGDGSGGAHGHDLGEGSNNWVVGSQRSQSGHPVLASDPHNGFDHPSQWYEAHLHCGDIDAIGAFYLGTPGIYMGRTRGACWGLTNHLASGRDLYVETVRDGCYRDGDDWHPLRVEQEEVGVRDAPSSTLRVEHTARGPLINEFVRPVADDGDPPLSLRWAGASSESGFEAMLELMRARDQSDVLHALERWPFPNLNFVFADEEGRIGYHVAGTVPRRRADWLGFRPANDPAHAWNDCWIFAELPQLIDPECSWVATANNPPLSGSGPYVLLGHWADGYRFQRIRQRIEAKKTLSVEEVANIQSDVCHPRAVELAPLIADHLRQSSAERAGELASILRTWNGYYTTEATAPALFEAFWLFWRRRVAAARFPERWVDLAAERSGALARRLLLGEIDGWFDGQHMETEIRACWSEALAWLETHCGKPIAGWRWGHLHSVCFPHPLGQKSERLRALFSPGPFPTSGGSGTVRAAGFSTEHPFAATSGSTYRLVVDMAREGWAMATTTGGRSGHPYSPHYANHVQDWLHDRYHPLVMDPQDEDIESRLTLVPTKSPDSPQ